MTQAQAPETATTTKSYPARELYLPKGMTEQAGKACSKCTDQGGIKEGMTGVSLRSLATIRVK
jgi:hypothetical protein